MTMQVVAYPHFTQEHNHNHHRYVAMNRDGASATRGRGFWKHLAVTIPLQWLSTHKDISQKFPDIHNPVLLRTILSLLIATALFLYDTAVGSTWLTYSVSAVFLLEYMNYIRHYGLHREEDEAVTELHSWDSEGSLESLDAIGTQSSFCTSFESQRAVQATPANNRST